MQNEAFIVKMGQGRLSAMDLANCVCLQKGTAAAGLPGAPGHPAPPPVQGGQEIDIVFATRRLRGIFSYFSFFNLSLLK